MLINITSEITIVVNIVYLDNCILLQCIGLISEKNYSSPLIFEILSSQFPKRICACFHYFLLCKL